MLFRQSDIFRLGVLNIQNLGIYHWIFCYKDFLEFQNCRNDLQLFDDPCIFGFQLKTAIFFQKSPGTIPKFNSFPISWHVGYASAAENC